MKPYGVARENMFRDFEVASWYPASKGSQAVHRVFKKAARGAAKLAIKKGDY